MSRMKLKLLMLCLLLCSIQHVQSLQLTESQKQEVVRIEDLYEHAPGDSDDSDDLEPPPPQVLQLPIRVVFIHGASLRRPHRFSMAADFFGLPHIPDAAHLTLIQSLIARRLIPELVPNFFEFRLTNAVANYFALLVVNYFFIAHSGIVQTLGRHRCLDLRMVLMILSTLVVAFLLRR